ncbi:hypothetical protein ACKTEK_03565 [Tepidamorphus sp. 3E244]|uniref:dioxygenase family protein n=1 Tax=Tepidamorphus sp. 3E244 TaxID=3385498 RepID=UPI0038FC0A08
MSEHRHDEPTTHLQEDMRKMINRRWLVAMLAGGTGVAAASFGLKGGTPAMAKACTVMPTETRGPFPADGSNNAHGTMANVLLDSGLIRRDMRKSFGEMTGVADGRQLELEMKVTDASNGCSPLAGNLVYAWHCTADGQYSIYNIESENYLRAAGVTDENGIVRFTTIYPGCYPGRAPHVHFEVYPSAEQATSYQDRLLASQFAFPDAINEAVYTRDAAYAASQKPFEDIRQRGDVIFDDANSVERRAQTLNMAVTEGEVLRGSIEVALASA